MLKNALIVALALTVGIFAARLVHVENQRYALIVGMCRGPNLVPDLSCLETVETRTSWLWHLFYGLTD